MAEIHDILRSNTSKFNVELTLMQKSAVEQAMTDYAVRAVIRSRNIEDKKVVLEGIKLFPALFKGEFILWLRKKSFESAKRQAQKVADTDGYKVYVIRNSMIGYTLMTTLDVRQNKRLRVFGKEVDAIKLEETAAFTATKKSKPIVIKRK